MVCSVRFRTKNVFFFQPDAVERYTSALIFLFTLNSNADFWTAWVISRSHVWGFVDPGHSLKELGGDDTIDDVASASDSWKPSGNNSQYLASIHAQWNGDGSFNVEFQLKKLSSFSGLLVVSSILIEAALKWLKASVTGSRIHRCRTAK